MLIDDINNNWINVIISSLVSFFLIIIKMLQIPAWHTALQELEMNYIF